MTNLLNCVTATAAGSESAGVECLEAGFRVRGNDDNVDFKSTLALAGGLKPRISQFNLLQKVVQPVDSFFICRHDFLGQGFEVLAASRVDLEIFLFRFGQ